MYCCISWLKNNKIWWIFGDQLFRFDMWKVDWKTSNLFYNFDTLIIKHYNLSIHKWYCCVFFFYVIYNISNFNLYNYNSKKLIQLIKLMGCRPRAGPRLKDVTHFLNLGSNFENSHAGTKCQGQGGLTPLLPLIYPCSKCWNFFIFHTIFFLKILNSYLESEAPN
jgi:hypothetical protein